MKAAVFAHYDRDDIVDEYVLHCLRSIRPYFDLICFVSTAALDLPQRQMVLSLADRVICRDNVGYDFLSWRVGYESLPTRSCNEIYFINDSIYGPCRDVRKTFDRLRNLDGDLCGASISCQFRPHVQSYFMSFRSRLLDSGFAKSFWTSIEPIDDKDELIQRCEIGLSDLAERNGFRIAAAADFRTLDAAARQRALMDNGVIETDTPGLEVRDDILLVESPNPVQLFWAELFRRDAPFLKVELLRDNPNHASRRSVFDLLASDRWYDRTLILGHLSRVMPAEPYRTLMRDLDGRSRDVHTSVASSLPPTAIESNWSDNDHD